MGLGKFFHNATKAAGKVAKHGVSDIQHQAEGVANSALHAAKQAGSAALVSASKGLQGATKGIGKVGIGKFNVANLSKTATHAGIGNMNLANASKGLTKAIAKVSHLPVLGPIIGVTTGLPLINAVNNAANGQRIDRAALGALNETVKDYKEIGPYAASVIAFVPGVGPGVGAGINAGLALAEGKRWSDVAMAAAKGSIPGGAIAQGIFEAAQAAARGKPLDQIGLAALPLDDKAKQAIGAAVALTKDLASGKRLDQALLARVNDVTAIAGVPGQAAHLIQSGTNIARDLAAGKNPQQAIMGHLDDALAAAGPTVANALKIGSAIGTARALQDHVMQQIAHPDALNALHELGHDVIAKNPALSTGLAHLSSDPTFHKGAGIASALMHGHKIDESHILGARNALSAEGKKGFDSAMSYFVGKHAAMLDPKKLRAPTKLIQQAGKVAKLPAKKATEAQNFAYFATHGLAGAGDAQKKVLLQKMSDAHPEMKDGIADAVRSVASDRKANPLPANRGFLDNMKAFFATPEHQLRKAQ